MKKMSKKELIKVLSNKTSYTYNELAELTGYHPKSLIRISSMIKKERYNLKERERNKIYEEIITNYLNSNYKTYKAFYNSNLFKYNISYSTLCNILKNAKLNKEIVFVRKVKNKENCYFEIADYTSKSILFKYNSIKNDSKTIKNIIYLIFKNYGIPQNISFVNFFSDVPSYIQYLLNKYNVYIINFKSCYRSCFNHTSKTSDVKYREKNLFKEDFYNSIVRKTIDNNMIQFNNKRYKIETNILIKRNTTLILYYGNEKTDQFIKYNNKFYKLIPIKNVKSKKGSSKYF